jgi:hypothetical protein
MRKGKAPDLDPYLSLTDPDPGGPKTCGSGSPTLLIGILYVVNQRQRMKPTMKKDMCALGLGLICAILRFKLNSLSVRQVVKSTVPSSILLD